MKFLIDCFMKFSIYCLLEFSRADSIIAFIPGQLLLILFHGDIYRGLIGSFQWQCSVVFDHFYGNAITDSSVEIAQLCILLQV